MSEGQKPPREFDLIFSECPSDNTNMGCRVSVRSMSVWIQHNEKIHVIEAAPVLQQLDEQQKRIKELGQALIGRNLELSNEIDKSLKLEHERDALKAERDELLLNESKLNGALSTKQEIIDTLRAERDEWFNAAQFNIKQVKEQLEIINQLQAELAQVREELADFEKCYFKEQDWRKEYQAKLAEISSERDTLKARIEEFGRVTPTGLEEIFSKMRRLLHAKTEKEIFSARYQAEKIIEYYTVEGVEEIDGVK